ncbi:Cupin domain-containing protein [Geodermatophilus saharensis]|uniref:Cupin domain-containing protein n=1 Tax=Geodermatophilus saharensis TaxID=1137994 RepID=A0A239EV16_9ACTN|nr:cupin domain-containing protein [Geodermatophilus saharensis]SNS48427.1 Cupin domain-containing protein [Geodermatophilus saharensis]
MDPQPVHSPRRGEVFTNPRTGERAVLLTDPEGHPDRTLVAHLFVRPGGRVAAAHVHPGSSERFSVLAGRVAFLVGEEESVLGPGESAAVPPGTVHDWWQVGDEEAQVLVEVAPGDRFVRVVATTFGLARDGLVDARGLPRLLQAAVTLRAYRDTIVFTTPPPRVQRVLFGALAPVGRLLGRQPVDPGYLFSRELADLDPAALALLDERGRLRREPGDAPGAATARRTDDRAGAG